MYGRPTAEIIELVAPDVDAAAEARRVEGCEVSDTDKLQALPGAKELFRRILADRLAVVISGTQALATARLHAVGLHPPSVLVTADRVQRGKPDPEAYLLAARGFGVAPGESVVSRTPPRRTASRWSTSRSMCSDYRRRRERPLKPCNSCATCLAARESGGNGFGDIRGWSVELVQVGGDGGAGAVGVAGGEKVQ